MSDVKKTYTQDEVNKIIVNTEERLQNSELTYVISRGWSVIAGGQPTFEVRIVGGDPKKIYELGADITALVLEASYKKKSQVE